MCANCQAPNSICGIRTRLDSRTHTLCGIKALASTPPPSCHSNAQTANLPRSIEPIRALQAREPFLALLFFNGWHTIVQFYPYKTSVNYSNQRGLKIYFKNSKSYLFASVKMFLHFSIAICWLFVKTVNYSISLETKTVSHTLQF